MYERGWTIIQQHIDSSKNESIDDPCELCIIFRNQAEPEPSPQPGTRPTHSRVRLCRAYTLNSQRWHAW